MEFIEYCTGRERMFVSVSATWSWGSLEAELTATAQHHEYHINSPGKDQSLEFNVQFLLDVYCFHTIIKVEKSWVKSS